MIRCFDHNTVLLLAEYARVPVINALTNRSHPCQLMADLQTMIEYHGPLIGQSVAWLGDGNNVATSWVEAAVLFGFQLRLACPHGMYRRLNYWLGRKQMAAILPSQMM